MCKRILNGCLIQEGYFLRKLNPDYFLIPISLNFIKIRIAQVRGAPKGGEPGSAPKGSAPKGSDTKKGAKA